MNGAACSGWRFWGQVESHEEFLCDWVTYGQKVKLKSFYCCLERDGLMDKETIANQRKVHVFNNRTQLKLGGKKRVW